MGHATSKSYYSLQKRLDRSIQGAPVSDTLFEILQVLYAPEEARLVSFLPLKPFTAKKAAKIWKKQEKEAVKILNKLADKGLLFDMKGGDEQVYVVPPTMAGFFEFALMRTDGKFDRKVLSELFHQYINIEEDFVHDVFGIDPSLARTYIHEDTIQKKDIPTVLDYERASKAIDNAKFITLGQCYCRHKKEHTGGSCEKPRDVCLTFNGPAESLAKHGISKKITKKKAQEVLKKCVDLGLVQIGDNIQNNIAWICNCCSCCCEALVSYRRLGYMKINTNFYSKNNTSKCTGCTLCTKKCPVEAITMKKKGKKSFSVVDIDKCIGCGVCTRFCPTKSLVMERREETKFVPKDSLERFVLNAIKQGKLQNYIFDNYSLWTHDILRAIFGVLLRLKPTKMVLANQQVRSRYLRTIAKAYYKKNNIPYSEKDIDYSHQEMNKGSK